ncbi:MAG: hypothetical protein AAGA57_00425 [Planctomycetota bacterium]
MREALRRWGDAIQTVVVTTIIALLIWAYAESASVQTYTDQPVSVVFVGPEGDRVGIDPGDASIEVTFRASKAQLADLRERLNEGPLKIQVGVGEAGAGPEVVDYGRSLTEGEFGALGISIDEVRPESAAVEVERLTQVTLPVDVDVQVAGLPVSSARPPEAQPRAITVTLPSRLSAAAKDLRFGARVDANAAQYDPANPPPAGEPLAVNAPLVLPFVLQSRWTEFSPATAKVLVYLEQRAEELDIGTRSVKITVADGLDERYRIDIPDDQRVVTDLRLTGPAEAIAALRNGAATEVQVLVSPNSSDLDDAAGSGEPYPMPLKLLLPSGLGSVRPVDPLGTVDILVREREPGASASAVGDGG